MANKGFIGIKRIWYGNVVTADLTPSTIATWIAGATEIKNSHDGTWSYSQDDPSVTDYKNELSGKPYFRDITDGGAKTIKFTIGQYEFSDKAALQGGTVILDNSTAVGWKAPTTPAIIYKAVCCQTKTGSFVIFTNASIVGKTEMAEKNMGLGVTAVAMDNPNTGVLDEYWFDADAVTIQ